MSYFCVICGTSVICQSTVATTCGECVRGEATKRAQEARKQGLLGQSQDSKKLDKIIGLLEVLVSQNDPYIGPRKY